MSIQPFGAALISNETLQWRHNRRDSVSNHQPHDCFLNRLFRHRKKTSKLRVTGLWEGNSPVTGEFPAQMASNRGKCFLLMTSSWLDHEQPCWIMDPYIQRRKIPTPSYCRELMSNIILCFFKTINNKACHPVNNNQQLFLSALIIYKSSHWTSFEEQTTVHFICACPIFKRVAQTWLYDKTPG